MATYEEVMSRDGNPVYKCGGNLMWINPFKSPTPGVPINTASIQTLKDHYFKQPREMYPKVTQVAVWGATLRTLGRRAGWCSRALKKSSTRF